jgi:hypothetical protein
MEHYLLDLRRQLKADWAGSLVKVASIKGPYAKEYLNKLSKMGEIERVSWGWYWVPSKLRGAQEFLRKDKNFKVLADQTAASFWNHDFVHRETLIVKVNEKSYAKALEKFAEKRGWSIHAIYTDEQPNYVSFNGLRIETMEQSIINCLKSYAFEDAFAAIRVNRHKIKIDEIGRRHYWELLPHSKVRIGPILAYSWARMSGGHARRIGDDFVRRTVDDALAKVISVG